MDDRALKALKGSIAHWRRVEVDRREPVGVPYCPLCKEFYGKSSTPACGGCPISAKTGRTFCRGTPVADYLGSDPEPIRRLIAGAEREFLESLLPNQRCSVYIVEDDTYLPPLLEIDAYYEHKSDGYWIYYPVSKRCKQYFSTGFIGDSIKGYRFETYKPERFPRFLMVSRPDVTYYLDPDVVLP